MLPSSLREDLEKEQLNFYTKHAIYEEEHAILLMESTELRVAFLKSLCKITRKCSA
jgi:hypothetical protein